MLLDAITTNKITSDFSVSLSETTDGGIGIASSFMLANESDTGLRTAGLTLTFTDGSKLDVINAGNAAALTMFLFQVQLVNQVLLLLLLTDAQTGLRLLR